MLATWLALFLSIGIEQADAPVRCAGWCEYYSPYVNVPRKNAGFVGKIAVNFHWHGKLIKELDRYQIAAEMQGTTLQATYHDLYWSCIQTAADNTSNLYSDTPYAPRIIASPTETIPADPAQVCTIDDLETN